MLTIRATRSMAISPSRFGNSLIFRSSLFLSALLIFRAFLIIFTATVSIPALIAGCACRARISLRTCWSRWSRHWGCRWSRLAPRHK